MKARRKHIVLFTAGIVLLLVAVALNYRLEHLGERAKIANTLIAFGLDVDYDDVYVTGTSNAVSVRELMQDVDLDAAIRASVASGFAADVDTAGRVVVFLAAVGEERVATVYTVNSEIQLGFIQMLNSYEVESLWQESA